MVILCCFALQRYDDLAISSKFLAQFRKYAYFCAVKRKLFPFGLMQGLLTDNYSTKMTDTLDEIDIQLLKTLQKNAKLTTKELADAVHLTPTPVFERQKRLERQGYIRKYVAVLDPEKLGLGLLVFCKVKLKQINHEIADSFTRRILRMPEVTECYNTSGAYDYLLKVRARDMKQYQEFILTKLGELDTVSSIESTFVMCEVKENLGINL